MPNSRQTSVMASPSRSRATKRRRSSITELAFHGIHTSHRTKAESVTHVSGTFCHLCLRPLIKHLAPSGPRPRPPKVTGGVISQQVLRDSGSGPCLTAPDTHLEFSFPLANAVQGCCAASPAMAAPATVETEGGQRFESTYANRIKW